MMKIFNWALINSLLSLIIVLFSCNTTPAEKESRVANLPYFNEATFTPQWLAPKAVELDTFHQIPAFQLINQEGEQITEASFEGKIYVTDFFFTSCPGICAKMTANMRILQDAFQDDNEIMLLSHSVTPERDSASVLKSYAERKGIRSNTWYLATGDQAEIYNLGRKAYFVEEDLGLEKGMDEFLHTENFVLVDKQRHIRGIYNGLNSSSIKQLIADIKTLKKEG